MKGKAKVYEESESDSEENSDEEPTKESLEKAMMQTVKEFSVYVRAITKDLEEHETKEIDEAKKKGNNKIKAIWRDSTFKIDFISGLLSSLLTAERLIKYYIVYIWPMKKYLKARNQDFFLKNKHIYPGADEEDIAFFKALWTVKGAITETERNTIWDYWDTLIDITEDWKALTNWVRSDKDDMWIVDIDYKKAEKNMEKASDEEPSEDEEELEKARKYMQANFSKEYAKNNGKNNTSTNRNDEENLFGDDD